MTNEAAFEKWAIDYGLDYEPSFTRYDVEAAWQAAIAYMQEKCEPVYQVAINGLWLDTTLSEYIKHNGIKREIYTLPQHRDWVGLSDSEWVNIVNHDHAYDSFTKDDAVHYAVKATEAKLKQLNTKG